MNRLFKVNNISRILKEYLQLAHYLPVQRVIETEGFFVKILAMHRPEMLYTR